MLNTSLLSYGTFAKTLTFPLLKFMSKPTDLKTLLKPIRVKKIQGANVNPLIQNLALHSQCVQPGSLFFVVSGVEHDGADFIDEAVSRGAQVIVTEKLFPHLRNILQVQVEDVREAMSKVAKVFYGFKKGNDHFVNRKRCFFYTASYGFSQGAFCAGG